MRFLLLACDYDGTLAREGRVDVEEERALERLRASGRKIVLMTGRLLENLLAAFPKAVLCDRIVAENGAVLHAPETRETRLLAKPPPEEFARALERRIGAPPAAGLVIVATGRPHEAHVLEVIRELGLEFHVTFNRGAGMALPPGVTKATGLARGDYSRWIRESIKDEDLAAEVEEIERARKLSPREARSHLPERIEARYAGPA
ncbi:MAG: HAD family hydrolase [Planctomycetota bacterium]